MLVKYEVRVVDVVVHLFRPYIHFCSYIHTYIYTSRCDLNICVKASSTVAEYTQVNGLLDRVTYSVTLTFPTPPTVSSFRPLHSVTF